jgi:hypothetical protein
LIPKFTRNSRIRKFLEPGDCSSVKIEVKEGDCRKHQSEVVVAATMTANGNRIMQTEIGFETYIHS